MGLTSNDYILHIMMKEFEFMRGELRAIKALLGRQYASDTEAEEEEETEETEKHP